MASGVPAYVNSKMLGWARETAGMDRATVAQRLHTSVERVAAWENGDSLPTMRQARILAGLYKRPLSLFYFEEPPAEPPRPTDFRLTTDRRDRSFPPALVFAIRDAHSRRDAAIHLMNGVGRPIEAFRLKASLRESAEVVGERLRKWTRLSTREQATCTSPGEFYNLIRTKFEDRGILTFQMRGVADAIATGFSIAESLMPVISVNGKTNPVRRLFTLFHELAHITLRHGGLCDLSSIDESKPKQPVETYCNLVAGAALIPRDAILSHPVVSKHPDGRHWDDSQIKELASTFCVSRYVVLIRLGTVKKASQSFIDRRLSEYRKQEGVETSAAHFVWVHDRVAAVNGRLFARLVLDSYFNEQISLREVSDLLDLNLEYLDRLADKVYREAS